MNTINEVILASKSPRRQELLKIIFDQFKVVSKDVDETLDLKQGLDQALKQLAYKKACEVFKEFPNALVIGADTMVILDDQILGKPKSKLEAYQYLSALSNRWHEVKTAISILYKDQHINFVQTSKVKFMALSETEINQYIETSEPYDKAGGYGIQGFGAKYIEKIDGDYYNIMGLPINSLYQHLKQIR